ncbi:MarR family transcriptional regulator [Actinomadura algeriensis]|uniref:DNA-binding MarR family transcriptional regulator n=1 Tax=Actinomadura algeriensis TaxID=1679523 RepID=A0ABR9JIW0_9ACTN|nr:helix-turn-helix domain-containing protein [Actinomadura algeriensis]MBE1530358.1 DNA-binding MarR family transcriptional regulator [Actinomadura algeriensis]
MAAKKTTNTTAGNGPTGTENAVTGAAGVAVGARQLGAAGAVWDALTANPGATVATIAMGAGVSKSLAARTLANLEGEGRAVRERGGRDGGKRLPDAWNAVAPDTADPGTGTAATDEPDTAPADPDEDATGTTATDTAGADTTGTSTGNGDSAGAADAGMDSAAVAEARDALTAMSAAVTAALEALDGGDGAGAMVAIEGVYSGSGKARRLVRAAAVGRPRTGSGQPRSAPGEMRAKVAAHLTAHPEKEFTPHEIAKVIGHSAGAVSNALDRLAEAGEAELVCDRPRRFTTTAAR